ncbi:MAG: TerB family tellurite resistance protein [Gemmatimonadetes bacterium]|nr:TerB family tellurite resistance protein [Gemmatimonadota bacterium]
MTDLNALSKAILLDGKIDAGEVAVLRGALYADGRIDAAEADLLFELNNKCSGADNDPSWGVLFSEAICSFLLDDDRTPGVVDEGEADWLILRLEGDGKVDAVEKQLLEMLAKRATGMPPRLTAFIAAQN